MVSISLKSYALNSLMACVLFVLGSCSTTREKDFAVVIDKNRLRVVEFGKCKFVVLDTYEDSVKNILNGLSKQQFPVFEISCYAPRSVMNNQKVISIHAYASAIDLNPKQNPYVDACKSIIIPTPDRSYCSENEDFYINRNVVRVGMVTPAVVDIFARNGFTVWGGMWKRPMDYMHFQTTRAIAVIVSTLPPSQAKIFWNYYLKNPILISMDKFFASSEVDPKEIVLDKLIGRMSSIYALSANS
jgi:hypothetical protein